MKKINNFIVEKRNFILILFVILTGISIFLSSKVNINYEMSNYLPNKSETKIGNDIMNKEFSQSKTSTLRIMLKDLNDKDKDDAKKYFSNIDKVSVEYDKSERYNKDNYSK